MSIDEYAGIGATAWYPLLYSLCAPPPPPQKKKKKKKMYFMHIDIS